MCGNFASVDSRKPQCFSTAEHLTHSFQVWFSFVLPFKGHRLHLEVFVFGFMDLKRHLIVAVWNNVCMDFLMLIRLILFLFNIIFELKRWTETRKDVHRSNCSSKFRYIFIKNNLKFIVWFPSSLLSEISLHVIASEYTAGYKVTEEDAWASSNRAGVWNNAAAFHTSSGI